MPVVIGARKKAMDAQDAANMHQLGIAFHMYAADNDGAFPAGLRTYDPTEPNPAMQVKPASGLGWTGLIYPYAQNDGRVFASTQESVDMSRRDKYVSYAMNSNCAAMSLGSMTAPSRTVLAFESRRNPADPRVAIPTTFPASLGASGNGMAKAGWNVGCVLYPNGTWYWGIWQSSATAKVVGPDGVPAFQVPPTAEAQFHTGNLGGVIDPALPLPANYDGFKGPHQERALVLMADGSVRSERPERVSPGTDATDASCNQGAKRDGHDVQPQPTTCSTVYPISAAGTQFTNAELPGSTGAGALDFNATFSTK
jgi:hypothetical protein